MLKALNKYILLLLIPRRALIMAFLLGAKLNHAFITLFYCTNKKKFQRIISKGRTAGCLYNFLALISGASDSNPSALNLCCRM